MANPRNVLDYKGIKPIDVTFSIDGVAIQYSASAPNGSVSVGLAVTQDGQADDTVTLCGDGETVTGKLIKVEADGKATVQVFGGMTLPAGASATVTPGLGIVGALGASSAEGYIRSAPLPGGSYDQAVATDNAKKRGRIVNNNTTTAVQILLI